MSLRIVFRATARREFESASAWYGAQCSGLGEEFLIELDTLISHIAGHPKQYPIIHRDVRRAVMLRFPYSIYFRIRSNSVVVLSVFHGHRDPTIWQSRQ